MDHEAERLIQLLDLAPHPEGGWYAETWRAPSDARPASTAIHFLLCEGERSHWHRVDADEIWCHHSGAPLELRIDHDGSQRREVLGSDVSGGEQPQAVVPAGQWQAAQSLGAWSLMTCVVAPGFSFDGFELAPDGWEPGGHREGASSPIAPDS